MSEEGDDQDGGSSSPGIVDDAEACCQLNQEELLRRVRYACCV